jgi:hypothetical protein
MTQDDLTGAAVAGLAVALAIPMQLALVVLRVAFYLRLRATGTQPYVLGGPPHLQN